MGRIALCTREELEVAFALILPAAEARTTADEWWARFAETTDERGMFLWEAGQLPGSGLPPVAAAPPTERQLAMERQLWGEMSVQERREILLRFSSFHLRLLGLVSDDLFERMRTAEGLTLEAANHGRAQTRRIIAAINGKGR